MGRMHARRRGVSRSHRPPRDQAPEWQGLSKDEIVETVVKLAKEGKSGAYIGLVLRDQYAVPNVKAATGQSMAEILASNDVAGPLPEDLANLMRRAVHLKGHLAQHRRDIHNARGLALIESRIRRLADYYRASGKLPADWRYNAQTAQLVVD